MTARGRSLKSSHMEPKYKGKAGEGEENWARSRRLHKNAIKKKKTRQKHER